MHHIAILGAGIAGCTLAQSLRKKTRVQVFEKSRGPGGRLSTRRGEEFTFDHGAQFFTGRAQQFLQFLAPYLKSGLIQGWNPKLITLGNRRAYKRQWFEPHFVAVPGMAAWIKELAAPLPIHFDCTIQAAERRDGKWFLRDAGDQWHGPFDLVLSTAPAPQTATLFPSLAPLLAGVRMLGCFAWLLGFEQRTVPWEAAVVQNSPLNWLAWNDTKPGRGGPPALVVHSRNDWAQQHLEDSSDEVQKELARALAECAGIDAAQARFGQLHRWRYASTKADLGHPYLLDLPSGLAACGDWCLQGRVEGAFLSAFQLAEFLLAGLD